MMVTAAPRVARRVRDLSPRAAVLTGGALMVAGQVVFAVLLVAGDGLPTLDASALLVVPVVFAGIAMLWLGPVVVSVAAGQSVWIGATALPAGYVVWILGTLWSDALGDGLARTILEGALPVFCFAGALAVVGGGRAWHRLAGVAVVAGFTGALASLVPGVAAIGLAGLLAAVGILAWIAPRTGPSNMSGSADATATSPADGR